MAKIALPRPKPVVTGPMAPAYSQTPGKSPSFKPKKARKPKLY
jgi:hypothetical protein